MSDWHKARYGDPCGECGYRWPGDHAECEAVVRSAPATYRTLLVGSEGSERHPDVAWSAVAYVCHVTDNLRVWAERLAAAAIGGSNTVATYDTELLAQARNYSAVPLDGAMWSLSHAASDWLEAVGLASTKGVVLVHPERGTLTTPDVVSGNAHDVFHHGWDISRAVAATR